MILWEEIVVGLTGYFGRLNSERLRVAPITGDVNRVRVFVGDPLGKAFEESLVFQLFILSLAVHKFSMGQIFEKRGEERPIGARLLNSS